MVIIDFVEETVETARQFHDFGLLCLLEVVTKEEKNVA